MGRPQRRLRLLQPEPHIHLAVHGRGVSQVLVRLHPIACATVEFAEAEVAAGRERAHLELAGPDQCSSVVCRGRRRVEGEQGAR